MAHTQKKEKKRKAKLFTDRKLSIRNIVSVGYGYGDGNDDNGDADVDRKLAEIIRPSTNDSKCFCYYYCSFKQLCVHCKKKNMGAQIQSIFVGFLILL